MMAGEPPTGCALTLTLTLTRYTSDRLHVQVVTLVVPLDDAGLLKVRPTVRVRLRLRLRLRVFGLGIGLGY